MKTAHLFFLLCCPAVWLSGPAGAETWILEDITAPAYYYVWNLDACLAPNGTVRAAVDRQDWLRYATNGSGSWSVTGDLTSIDGNVSIAVDSAGFVHVASYRWVSLNDQSLVYATNLSGSWAYTVIPTPGAWYQSVSIALDSADHVYIAYCEADNAFPPITERLYYVTNATGAWVNHLISSGGTTSIGRFCSLAIDSNDALHVSYCRSDEGRLYYSTNASGAWAWETVNASPADYANDTAIALDGSDRPCISYYEYENSSTGRLRYACKLAGVWNDSVVDDSGNAGSGSSLAVTAAGSPRIAYFDEANGRVKYARNSTGSWYRQDVADCEGPCAIALDPVSYDVHIVFDNQQLRHATAAPVTPRPPTNLNASLLPGQIHITWEDHSTNESGFRLQSLVEPGIYPLVWSTLADLGPNVTSTQLDGPSPNMTYHFRICAYNNHGDSTWSNEDSVSVTALLKYIDVTSPDGGENWPAGSAQTITWVNGWNPPSQVNLYYSLDGGSNWTTAATNRSNTGSYAWTVPMVSSSHCLVKVQSATGSLYGLSYAPFTISYRPDLVVESIETVPRKPIIGQPFQLKVMVKNQGTVAAGPFWLSWYKHRSTPPPISAPGDEYEQVTSLAAGASYTMTKTVTSWQTGTFSMWAQADIDDWVVEIDETNNILGPQALDVLEFQVSHETGTAGGWFGGDNRPDFKPRNVGAGQSITWPYYTRIRSAAFYFSSRFDYSLNPDGHGHEVTLVLNCRAPNGTILSTADEVVPASFEGGWVYFDMDQYLCPGTYLYTCYVLNGESNELKSTIRADNTDSYADGDGYSGITYVYGGNMESWAIWQVKANWDYHFRLGGFYMSSIPGDITSDNEVDMDDLEQLAQWWMDGSCCGCQWCGRADTNCDGAVNLKDLATLSAGWEP